MFVHSSPVSGSVELWVNSGCLHAGPLRGCHQILLIDAVLQTVRDTACRGENRPLLRGLLGAFLSQLYTADTREREFVKVLSLPCCHPALVLYSIKCKYNMMRKRMKDRSADSVLSFKSRLKTHFYRRAFLDFI